MFENRKNNILEKFKKPYIIAEIGVNHEGSLKSAMRLIELAKEGGADAAKFQSYKANKLASKDSPSYWDIKKEKTKSQYELFKKYDNFGPNEYRILAEHCENCEIDFLSTPFDDDAIEFLDPLVPFFKVASADINNLPFLKKLGSRGKPIVLSTGASTLAEIDNAISTLENNGCLDIALLHCILNYPTSNKNANLEMISSLKKIYPNHIIGYSDHTIPDETMLSLTTSYLLGAEIIEKHFTHDKTLQGNDHYHAMNIEDLKKFVNFVDKIKILKGYKAVKEPISTELIARLNARRSIVTKKYISKDHIISENDITYKRPGTGISPEHWNEVIGMKTLSNLEEDHILRWHEIEKVESNEI